MIRLRGSPSRAVDAPLEPAQHPGRFEQELEPGLLPGPAAHFSGKPMPAGILAPAKGSAAYLHARVWFAPLVPFDIPLPLWHHKRPGNLSGTFLAPAAPKSRRNP